MAFDTSSSLSSPDWASQLDAIFARCEGAFSDITLRGYRRDLEIFAVWCEGRGEVFLPAAPGTVAGFIDDQALHYASATIRRRQSAIRFAHVMSDLPSPLHNSEVYLAIRRMGRAKMRRPRQVRGLVRGLLEKMVCACPETLLGKRDAALLSVGYDTLCRSSELSWMEVEHLDLLAGTVYIPRAKNDPWGDGRVAGLSRATVGRVQDWLDASGLHRGPLFRGLHLQRLGEGSLDTSSIRRIIKRCARRAGLDEEAAGLSGHSMRVGGAQDLLLDGHDTIAIMTAGGWKNVDVVARYVERVALKRR